MDLPFTSIFVSNMREFSIWADIVIYPITCDIGWKILTLECYFQFQWILSNSFCIVYIFFQMISCQIPIMHYLLYLTNVQALFYILIWCVCELAERIAFTGNRLSLPTDFFQQLIMWEKHLQWYFSEIASKMHLYSNGHERCMDLMKSWCSCWT